MKKFICLIILVASLRFSEGVFDLREYDQCSSEFTGDNGVCMEASKCAEFKTHRNKLKICSFRDKIPIVCCSAVDVRDLVKSGDIPVKRISAISKILDTCLKSQFRGHLKITCYIWWSREICYLVICDSLIQKLKFCDKGDVRVGLKFWFFFYGRPLFIRSCS